LASQSGKAQGVHTDFNRKQRKNVLSIPLFILMDRGIFDVLLKDSQTFEKDSSSGFRRTGSFLKKDNCFVCSV